MKDFKKLIVWQKSMELFIEVHKLAKKLPPEERYELTSQLRKAAFSIPSNIAEGSAKSTNAHYKQFLQNSLKDETNKLLEKVTEIQKMLISFINKLN